jgi:alpha-1,3-rhamnosyl/mannosyltransferase
VIDAFGIDASRVVVVPHGVRSTPIDNGVRVGGAAAPGAEQIEAVRRRYVLGDGPYVVYPAITHPHKNHQLLLDVMSRHWTDHALRLVLVGGAGAVEGDVARTIAERGLTDRVIRPGRVPGGDRDALIAGATALVFPSTYEGFGAPLIEAMAFGTPVVCGDHPALREVAGSAAIVLPADADAWSAALDEVDRRRAELVAAGHDRVSQYTLAASGVALVGAYHLSLS